MTESLDHTRIGADLFNGTWDLLELQDRSAVDDDTMLHMAHASRHHWGQAVLTQQAGPERLARGEWQISRVYSVLRRDEPALHHAQRCLLLCQEHGIGDFDLAFAYEALARASAVAGNIDATQGYLTQAREAAADIAEDEDRELLLTDLATIGGPVVSG